MEKVGAQEKMKYRHLLLFFSLLFCASSGIAQTDSTAEDDYSQLGYAGTETKTWANPKIFGLSPQRFVSIGFDRQLPYEMGISGPGSYAKDDDPAASEKFRVQQTGGLRLGLMIPLLSTNRFLWQTAANYWRTAYRMDATEKEAPVSTTLGSVLNERGLRNLNWTNTLFIPLNEHQFVLFQGQADFSGDYGSGQRQDLSSLRYSGALMWGKRPHDRKQWAIGLARTYRVGNMNYIPVLLFNYTSESRKWGTEVLFPARAHYRRTFSPRNLLLAGYELEGQSYRIGALSNQEESLEIRRGELRFRLDYQHQLFGFIWAGVQAGIRLDYSFDADYLPDGKEFFRGFFGNQTFAFKNNLSPAPYFQMSLNFVSP